MDCTAPTRGHRSPRAWARCPACRGGGGWAEPTANAGSATTAGATRFADVSTAGGLPSSSSGRRGPRPSRAAEIERALISAGLDAAASHDFTAALIDVATALDDEASKRSNGSHWLCALLADAADAVDPAAIAAATGDVFADALIEIGVPNWAASVIGWGVAKAVESTLSSLLPGIQLCLGLRALGLLVCPSPSGCPVQSRLSVPLLKAALASSPS